MLPPNILPTGALGVVTFKHDFIHLFRFKTEWKTLYQVLKFFFVFGMAQAKSIKAAKPRHLITQTLVPFRRETDQDVDSSFDPTRWTCASEGSIPGCPCCERVSDVVEVVAGHRSLQHRLALHIVHVVAAVWEQRRVRHRHALITKGDYCVSLRRKSHTQYS